MHRKPNFFIIGAPKCGTTSLWAWLSEHPNIFFSPEKEPHFFNTDDDRRGATTVEQYEALFRDVREEHTAIGEGSVWYLSSSTAIGNILQYQPSSRFIAMVRNPIEMAPALHGEMLFAGLENEHDFYEAWHLQEDRRQGRRLPAFRSWAQRRLLYGTICCLGAQVERLLSTVPSHQVLILLLDDVRADPRTAYLRALNFLNVPDDGRSNFPVHNPSKSLRLTFLNRLYPVVALKRAVGVKHGLGIWSWIQMANKVERPRLPLSPGMLDVLRTYFRDDIMRLGQLLDRDLSCWLS